MVFIASNIRCFDFWADKGRTNRLFLSYSLRSIIVFQTCSKAASITLVSMGRCEPVYWMQLTGSQHCMCWNWHACRLDLVYHLDQKGINLNVYDRHTNYYKTIEISSFGQYWPASIWNYLNFNNVSNPSTTVFRSTARKFIDDVDCHCVLKDILAKIVNSGWTLCLTHAPLSCPHWLLLRTLPVVACVRRLLDIVHLITVFLST